MERLLLIDGRRATWSRMLDTQLSGHGLVPWVSDIEWWDQVYSTKHLTGGEPTLLPAIVRWYAPSEEDEKYFDFALPHVVTNDRLITAFANSIDISHLLAHNTASNYDMYHPVEADQPRAIPLWAVTPIDDDIADYWSSLMSKHWSRFPEIEAINYFYSDYEACPDETGQCAYSPYGSYNRSPDPWFCHDCALHNHHIETVIENIQTNAYFPDLPDPFPQTWKWAINRYIRGWISVNELDEEHPCQYSWASWLSPYWDTPRYGDWTTEIERASSIPLTSSQLCLEF